jgi:hypothetical protein
MRMLRYVGDGIRDAEEGKTIRKALEHGIVQ